MHTVAVVLLWAGVGALVLSAVGTLLFDEPLDKLHFVTLAGSLGAPLVGIALVLQAPDVHTAVKDGLTVGVLTVFGPVVGSATARAHHIREGGERMEVEA